MPHAISHSGENPQAVDMPQCIQACLDCQATCVQTLEYCHDMGGRYVEPQHLAILTHCAAQCATSAQAMQVGSPLHEQACAWCAEVCERCAESCEQLGDNIRLQDCAKTCRACAQTCRDMASAEAKAKLHYDEVVADSFPASDPPAHRVNV